MRVSSRAKKDSVAGVQRSSVILQQEYGRNANRFHQKFNKNPANK
jgi:hypothetical protein